MATYEYGTGEAAARRKLIHEHIVAQRKVQFALPSNVRAVYYVGFQAGWWLDDASHQIAAKAGYRARGEDESRTPRRMSQNISDDVQWLIDHDLVDEDEIVDELAQTFDSVGTDDLINDVRTQAALVPINRWSPKPIPYLLAEGNNDLGIVAPLARASNCRWAALGGMGGRSQLRKVAAEIHPDAPVGYVGDWNKAGSDIERNAEKFLRSKGWKGKWTRIAITDVQAVGLPHKMKVDGRLKVPVALASIETAAMSVPVLRTAIQTWLDAQKPAVPDVDDDDRDDLVAWIDLFPQLAHLIDSEVLWADIEALIIDRRTYEYAHLVEVLIALWNDPWSLRDDD